MPINPLASPSKNSRKSLRVAAVGLFVVAVSTAGFFWFIPTDSGSSIPITQETTYLIEPVGKDGYVDYSGLIPQPEAVPPEENRAPPLLKIANQCVVVSHELATRPAATVKNLYDELGLEQNDKSSPEFCRYREYLDRRLRANEPLDSALTPGKFEAGEDRLGDSEFESLTPCLRNPWVPEDYPIVAEWLEASEAALETITDGLNRPHFVFVLRDSTDGQPPLEGLSYMIESIDEALTARALRHLGGDRIELAIRDADFLHRLATCFNADADEAERLTAIATKGRAFEVEIAIARALSKPADIQARWDHVRIQPIPKVFAAPVVTGLRVKALEFLQRLDKTKRRGPPKLFSSWSDIRMRYRAWKQSHDRLRHLDLEEISIAINRYYDRLLDYAESDAESDTPAQTCVEAFAQVLHHLEAYESDPTNEWWLGHALGISTIVSLVDADVLMANKVLLRDVFYASRLFELTYGRPASSQADLIPEFLEAWPTDATTGEPMAEQFDNGTWTIYARDASNNVVDKIPDYLRIDIPPMQSSSIPKD